MAASTKARPIDAGLIIHEGQLTFADRGLAAGRRSRPMVARTNRPAAAAGRQRHSQRPGPAVIREVNRLLKQSIQYGLAHRDEALDYALQYGRDLDRAKADRFVGMYVNDWTLDFGPRGREAVRRLLAEGHRAGMIPTLVEPEFVQ